MPLKPPVRVSADHRLAYLPAAQGRQSRKFVRATTNPACSRCADCAMYGLRLPGGCALPEICTHSRTGFIYVEATPTVMAASYF
jgi:hypothetical protein